MKWLILSTHFKENISSFEKKNFKNPFVNIFLAKKQHENNNKLNGPLRKT